MDREDGFVFRHLLDLAKASYSRDMTVFTDFLSTGETAILKKQQVNLPCGGFFLFGGIDGAERAMACFPSSYEEREDIEFPIDCIEIKIKNAKFESNSLSHRDFLGAVLGLGIERKLIGDIYTVDENKKVVKAYVFCQSKITEFIISELNQIGRYKVECKKVSSDEAEIVRKIEDKFCTVPSLRLDVLIGEAFNLSRTKVKILIDGGKVSVNSAEIDSSHYKVLPDDIISVRGFGKFIFYESLGVTKKERLQIHIGKYC